MPVSAIPPDYWLLRLTLEILGLLPDQRMITFGQATLLQPAFFDRDPRKVARSLLGKLLIRKGPKGIRAGRVVETEAYLGEGDAAAHATAGKTARNAVVFGPPGYAYVYFVYGNQYCLNVSCLPDGVPGCVLFRALEPVAGIEQMAKARGLVIGDQSDLKKISSGPGRMCEALGITRDRDNGKSLFSRGSDLQLVDDGCHVRLVTVTRRVGITKSADEELRYLIAGNAFVSQGSQTRKSPLPPAHVRANANASATRGS